MRNSSYEEKTFSGSSSYDKVIVENSRLPGIPFLALIPKVSNKDQIKIKAKIIERIVRLLNYISDIRFPEPIDIVNVVYPQYGLTVQALIIEYIRGKSLKEAIATNYFVRTKNIFDSFERETAPVSLRRVKHVLTEILKIQEDLYKKQLTHIGILPNHIMIQIDDIVKMTGLKHICFVKDDVLDDPAIVDYKKYGEVYKERFCSPYLKEYIDSKGKFKPSIFSLTAYQIAVILFDLVTKGYYIKMNFERSLVEDVEYETKADEEYEVRDVILKLIDGHDKNYFKSYSEIYKIISEIP